MPSSLLQSDGGAFIHMIMVGTFTYIFSIFVWFRCFQIFQENYLCAAKENDFGSYPFFEPLDQANLICF